MEENQNGLTNEQYADWMITIASQDCSNVKKLHIKYISGSEQTYENPQICEIMQSASTDQVALYKELKFSGHNGSDNAWHAIDKRLTTNLERTVNENYADMPIKIRRPTGS